MGIPISNYTIFKALTDKKIGSWEYEVACDCFKDFNILAFIIYDPIKHKELFTKLTNSFNVLDKKTGEKLLFFAVCNPPENWNEKIGNRSYFNVYNMSNGFKHNISNSNLSNQEAAYAIARELNIEPSNLPCIVVSNSFENKDFCWFKTCSEHIELQLINLGYIAEEYPQLKNTWQNYKKIMTDDQHNVDLCNGFGNIHLQNSIAKSLVDVLAFLDFVCGVNEEVRELAEKQISKTISRLLSEINTSKKDLQESNEDYYKFEELNIKLASLICTLNRESTVISSYIKRNESNMDIGSFSNIERGIKLLNILDSSIEIRRILGYEEEKVGLIDYTPSIICITKAFETEIGLSLGHTVRKKLGIKLPKYYNKYDQNLGRGSHSSILPHKSLVNSRPNPIDFNNRRGNDWMPPGMGQMLLAVQTLEMEKQSDIMNTLTTMNEPNEFLKTWKLIINQRNACAHTEYMTSNQAIMVKEYIEKLAKTNVFEVLNGTKILHQSL